MGASDEFGQGELTRAVQHLDARLDNQDKDLSALRSSFSKLYTKVELALQKQEDQEKRLTHLDDPEKGTVQKLEERVEKQENGWAWLMGIGAGAGAIAGLIITLLTGHH